MKYSTFHFVILTRSLPKWQRTISLKMNLIIFLNFVFKNRCLLSSCASLKNFSETVHLWFKINPGG